MTQDNQKADRAQIRSIIDSRGEAVRKKDIASLMAHVAADVLSFDVVNPLQYSGSGAIQKRAEEWFSSFRGPIGYDIRDLYIAVETNVAFSRCLTRVSGTTKDGAAIDMWLRSTVCYEKTGDKWMVTHEHNSVPFDPMTGQASLDLEPTRESDS